MLFEIINPSDPYTFRCEDVKVAQAATVVIGGGKLGLVDEHGNSHSLFFLFSSEADIEKALAKTFGDLGQFMEEHRLGIADALDSVMSVNMDGRQMFEDAMEAIDDPARREAFRVKAHDRNRSSLNDIGRRCWAYAKQLREPLEQVKP